MKHNVWRVTMLYLSAGCVAGRDNQVRRAVGGDPDRVDY